MEWMDQQLINVRMEDTVDKANRRRFVGVLVWQLNVDFPFSI